jgi:hypothetical protein
MSFNIIIEGITSNEMSCTINRYFIKAISLRLNEAAGLSRTEKSMPEMNRPAINRIIVNVKPTPTIISNETKI